MEIEHSGDQLCILVEGPRSGIAEFYGNWLLAASKAETFWKKHRAAKSERQDPYQRLDYSRGLTSQPLEYRYLVLYNAAGTNISAAVFDRKTTEAVFFVALLMAMSPRKNPSREKPGRWRSSSAATRSRPHALLTRAQPRRDSR